MDHLDEKSGARGVTHYGHQAAALITTEQRRRLEEVAQRRQVSVAAIVREAIRDFLERQSTVGAA